METVLGVVGINLGGDKFLKHLVDFDIKFMLMGDRDDSLLVKSDFGEFVIDVENVGYGGVAWLFDGYTKFGGEFVREIGWLQIETVQIEHF